MTMNDKKINIIKTTAFRSPDGKFFPTQKEAEIHAARVKFAESFEKFMEDNFSYVSNSYDYINTTILENLRELAELYHLQNVTKRTSKEQHDGLKKFLSLRFNENSKYHLKDITRLLVKDWKELLEILSIADKTE